MGKASVPVTTSAELAVLAAVRFRKYASGVLVPITMEVPLEVPLLGMAVTFASIDFRVTFAISSVSSCDLRDSASRRVPHGANKATRGSIGLRVIWERRHGQREIC